MSKRRTSLFLSLFLALNIGFAPCAVAQAPATEVAPVEQKSGSGFSPGSLLFSGAGKLVSGSAQLGWKSLKFIGPVPSIALIFWLDRVVRGSFKVEGLQNGASWNHFGETDQQIINHLKDKHTTQNELDAYKAEYKRVKKATNELLWYVKYTALGLPVDPTESMLAKRFTWDLDHKLLGKGTLLQQTRENPEDYKARFNGILRELSSSKLWHWAFNFNYKYAAKAYIRLQRWRQRLESIKDSTPIRTWRQAMLHERAQP